MCACMHDAHVWVCVPVPMLCYVCLTTSSGRGSRLAGFDAPFNMGSARCKIEWNDNFEAIYLKN